MGGWTVTGLRWRDGVPVLAATDGRREHIREVVPGMRVGWQLSGPRRCVGVRIGGRQRLCPYGETVDAGAKSAQCADCQRVDPGLALARDRIVDDGRTYRLYLAWFGEGLGKIGLTAEERGIGRLLEQAAPVFSFIGRGRLPAVRRAELTVAQAGLARERVPATVKSGAWWGLAGPELRRERLAALRGGALRLLDGHGLELLPDGPIVDQVELFGLAAGPPEAYQEVTELAPGATLAGTLRPAVGGQLFFDRPGGEPLLLDVRRLAGWGLRGVDVEECTGLGLRRRSRPLEEPAALF